jgi:signal transduction histidine kinase/ligand-binding sensor domain-containing protein
VVAFALLAAPPVLALSPEKSIGQLMVSVWQAKDGLPGGAIRSLSQAPDGAMWIAAFGGLARYDGERLVTMRGDPATRPVIADVSSMFAARDGSVWLEANGHQPIRIRGDNVAMLGTESGLPKGFEVSAWDEDDQGNVWMIGMGQIFRAAGERFVAHPVRGLDQQDVTELYVGNPRSIFIGTQHGLLRLVDGELVRVAAIPPTAAVSVLHADRLGILWVAAGGRLFGLADGRPVVAGEGEGMPLTHVAQMDDDEDGNLWIATDAGLVRRHNGRFDRFTVEDGLSDNDIADVVVDREGSLWVGTRNGGVAQFTDRTLDTLPPIALLDGVQVNSICEDADGALWFATRGRGAVRWKNARATAFTTSEGLPSNRVSVVLPTALGGVWLGTERGLRRLDAVVSNPGLSDDPVTALFQDREGALWIGGEGELARFDGAGLLRFSADEGIPAGEVHAIAEDASGLLWVSVGDALMRRDTDRFSSVGLPGGARFGRVEGLLADKQGALWISSIRAGLWRLLQGRFSFFDVEAAVDADTLYQLIEDDAGDLWVGTNRSVARISRASLEAVAAQRGRGLEVVSFENTDRRRGVVAAERRQPGLWKARDGRLWFATQQGPLSVDPRRVRANVVPPTVGVTSLHVDGRERSMASPVRLSAGSERIELGFAGVALRREAGGIRYRYKLEGYDREWVDAKTRRAAEYSGLLPGSYRFRIQAANGDGVWNEDGATFAFSLEPPLWRTPQFYVVCLLGLAAVGGLAHRARLARLRREFALILTERNRVARELHDTVLQDLSAMAVKLGAVRTRADGAPAALTNALSQLQEMVADCLNQTRGVVWEMRERARGGGDLGTSLARLVRRLCEGSGVAAGVEVRGPPVRLGQAVEDELFLITQEGVTNALKHARPRRLSVQLQYAPAHVVLVVSDDGNGFASEGLTAEAEGHFGLLGLRERAARLGAELQVRSSEGEGTTVEVVFPSRGRKS